MSWAKLDDAILDNAKIIMAGPAGLLLHVAAITWCARNLTDGRIPKRRVRSLVSGLDGLGTAIAAPPAIGPDEDGFCPLDANEIAAELATIGLWHDRGDYWELHDYLVYNPSRAKVLADREKTRQRVEKHRKRRRNAVSNGPVTGHPVPVPIPEVSSPDALPGIFVKPLARVEGGSGGKPNARAPARAPRASPKTPWPEDFTLTEERRQVALKCGLDPAWEWNKFRDHARAHDARYANWDAAWRNWCRQAPNFAGRGNAAR